MDKIVVAGYFDPPHLGHYQLFDFAHSYTPNAYVIAVIHNTDDVVKKSGFYIYNTDELRELLLAHSSVDEVVVASDTDGTITKTLEFIKPKYFIKGPDRSKDNMPKSELEICNKIDCEIVYQRNSLKVGNSSNIKARIIHQIKR